MAGERQGVRMMRGAARTGVLVTLGLLAIPATGASAATWEGRCEIAGTTTFATPIGGLPAEHSYSDSGTGLCTGTLDGVQKADTPIVLAAEGAGTLGCLAGNSIMQGTITFTQGTETPDDDVAHGYIGEASGGIGQFVSRTRGTNGGSGISIVSARSDQATFDACYAGTLGSVSWDATTRTFTPNEG